MRTPDEDVVEMHVKFWEPYAVEMAEAILVRLVQVVSVAAEMVFLKFLRLLLVQNGMNLLEQMALAAVEAAEITASTMVLKVALVL